MKKVRFTENIALQIVQGLFENININFGENELTVPVEWRGKSIMEALNVDYYTFKYRPLTTIELITREIANGATSINSLQALTRSFCLLYLGQIKRVFARDNDTFEVPVNLEFWVQTKKVQLLEMLISECNIELIGSRIPIAFGDEERRCAIQFGNLNVVDVVTGQPCGEMTVINCECTMVFSPNITDYSDYEIKIQAEKDGNWVMLPIFNFQAERVMTGKSVPYLNNPRTTGNINLSNSKTYTIGFYGFKSNEFVEILSNSTLSTNREEDNNRTFEIIIKRNGIDEKNTVIVSRHSIGVEPGTGYETHTVTLVANGKRD